MICNKLTVQQLYTI